MTSFVHLKLHSEYSLQDSVVRLPELLAAAKAQKMSALALTDHCNLFAVIKFYREALAAGIKPIIGADLLLESEASPLPSQLTVLCKNTEGYKNLIALISKAYLQDFKNNQPVIQWSQLVAHAEGLIFLSGGLQGEVGQALLAGNDALAQACLARWQQQFPTDFYVEIQRLNAPQEALYWEKIIPLAAALQLPVVATNSVRFLKKEDFDAHEARVCIAGSRVLADETRPAHYTDQQYLKSPEAMVALFADVPASLENTVEISKRCNLRLTLDENHLPQFPLPATVSLKDYFWTQALDGLATYLHKKNILPGSTAYAPYLERLEMEVAVIHQMGFSGYFLIVADFIAWAKRSGIPVGPGRGSGAGSLVAFAMGITTPDPLQHDLLFERFLNPERVSLPDFDIDFCMEQRDRVIDYVATRYGEACVAQIITFGSMAARAVVRDVGRVLGYPYGFVDKLAKLIPFEVGMTLEKALIQEEILNKRRREEEEVRILMDLALKLEGLARNAGKHAGGVVIAPTQLIDFTALYREENSARPVTQLDMDDIAAVGLVKFDFLGLRTLTIIDWALKNIQKQYPERELILIDELPLDDAKTFAAIRTCETTALFQLESQGMRDLIRRLQPDCFNDITALVALFRPGPLQSGMVDDYIHRKQGKERVEYPHPELESILRPTYGVILYQEQVMQIAQVLANYSLGGADLLRRAMGKKKPEEMAKQRAIFLEGAAARGVDLNVAARIFDLMEKFAAYGFNKSHSVAYALIAYQTAWLKAHYPAAFMAAVLSSDMDNTDKVVHFINECERLKLKILPPDINRCDYYFTVNKAGDIVYGLGAVKGVGRSLLDEMVQEREARGPYKSLFDFCERLQPRKLTRRALEVFIRSGAMDPWGVERARLWISVDKAFKMAEQKKKNEEKGQLDLFSGWMEEASSEAPVVDEYLVAPAWSAQQRLKGEKETLGYYLTGHPIGIYQTEIKQLTVLTFVDLPHRMQQKVTVAGLLLDLRVFSTRTQQRMAVLTFEDRTGTQAVTVFPDLYTQIFESLVKDQIYLIVGEVSADDFSGGVRIVATSVTPLEQMRKTKAKRIHLDIHEQKVVDDLMVQLHAVLVPYCGGKCPVVINYQQEAVAAQLELGPKWQVHLEAPLLDALRQLCGGESVLVEY